MMRHPIKRLIRIAVDWAYGDKGEWGITPTYLGPELVDYCFIRPTAPALTPEHIHSCVAEVTVDQARASGYMASTACQLPGLDFTVSP